MFKYAYNLDTEHLVIQMIACMIKFITYFRYVVLCFGRSISNVAGLSLLFKILIYACSVHFKTHSSNDMSTCGLSLLKCPSIPNSRRFVIICLTDTLMQCILMYCNVLFCYIILRFPVSFVLESTNCTCSPITI